MCVPRDVSITIAGHYNTAIKKQTSKTMPQVGDKGIGVAFEFGLSNIGGSGAAASESIGSSEGLATLQGYALHGLVDLHT